VPLGPADGPAVPHADRRPRRARPRLRGLALFAGYVVAHLAGLELPIAPALAAALLALIASRRDPAARRLAIIALAAFLPQVLEGLIIDIDHWRHVHVLAALIWGLAAARPSFTAVD
jgi:hypothetical protein